MKHPSPAVFTAKAACLAIVATTMAAPVHATSVIETLYESVSAQNILTKVAEYQAGIDDVIAAEDPLAAVEAFTQRFCSQFVVNYGFFGSYSTKPALRDFLLYGIAPAYSWGFHSTLNPRVYVNGTVANSKFYLHAYATPTGTTEKQVFFGHYDIDWKRNGGDWCISRVDLSFDE